MGLFSIVRLKMELSVIDLSSPRIMGILNITPDSFSDGGRYSSLDSALRQAELMHANGAYFIDVGGESTRPGAAKVSETEELDRVVPVIEKITSELSVTVSVDTLKPQVMVEAVKAGAVLVNDVNALRSEGALEAVSGLGVSVCLMHMQGDPETMQDQPRYLNVVEEVKAFLLERSQACLAAGIPQESIIIDPGFGFGKTLDQNYELFAALHEFTENSYPVLVGVSRKSMIGAIIDLMPEERVLGSAVLAAMAVERGASILRVHDVEETRQALALVQAVIDKKLERGLHES